MNESSANAMSVMRPTINLPMGKQLWELGLKENWPELDVLLDAFDPFWVVSRSSEDHMSKVLRDFNGSYDENGGSGILSKTLVDTGGDNAELLMRLVALGLDIDVKNKWMRTPGHHVGWYGRFRCAMVLSMCRPNLSATYVEANGERITLLKAARTDGRTIPFGARTISAIGSKREVVAQTWEEVARNGFPTIAQLACEQKWWAVKSLCRRRMIPETEKGAKFRGKDAIGWVEHHKQLDLARELRYLLLGLEFEGHEPAGASCSGGASSGVERRVEELQTHLDQQFDLIREGLAFLTVRTVHVADSVEGPLNAGRQLPQEADGNNAGVRAVALQMTKRVENLVASADRSTVYDVIRDLAGLLAKFDKDANDPAP